MSKCQKNHLFTNLIVKVCQKLSLLSKNVRFRSKFPKKLGVKIGIRSNLLKTSGKNWFLGQNNQFLSQNFKKVKKFNISGIRSKTRKKSQF